LLKTESLPTPSPKGSGAAALAAYTTFGEPGVTAIFVAYRGASRGVSSRGVSTLTQCAPPSTVAHTPFKSASPLSSDPAAKPRLGADGSIARSLNDMSAPSGRDVSVTFIHRRPPLVDFQTPFPPLDPCVCSSPTAA